MRTRAEIPTAEIVAAISEAGWHLESVEEGDDWRCRERWHLKSSWSPQDSDAFLFFLVDPQDDSSNRKLHAMTASSGPNSVTAQNAANRSTLYFGKGWPKKLPEFIGNLDSLRGKVQIASKTQSQD